MQNAKFQPFKIDYPISPYLHLVYMFQVVACIVVIVSNKEKLKLSDILSR